MKIKKLLSVFLAGLILTNSLGIISNASGDAESAPPVPPTSFDAVQDSAQTHTGVYIGWSLLAAGALAILGYSIYKCATRVTADDWFYRLGGTPQNIDEYRQLVNDYTDSGSSEIEKDVNRYPAHIIPGAVTKSENLKNIFNRILKIYYKAHTNVQYTQGWDYIMYMIYHKFVVTRNTQGPLNEEDEAKVYFIYTKFMDMINSKFSDTELWSTQANDYCQSSGVSIYANTFGATCKQTIFLRGILTAGAYLFLSAQLSQEIIDIWDHIIMDDKFVSPITHRFNEELVLNQLNNTIYSMLCERGKDGDALRREISGDNLRLTYSERTRTLTISL